MVNINLEREMRHNSGEYVERAVGPEIVAIETNVTFFNTLYIIVNGVEKEAIVYQRKVNL